MKIKYAFFATLLMASVLLASPPMFTKPELNKPLLSMGEGPNFCIDYSCFQGANDKTYVEFYFQVGYQNLQFFKHKGLFRAGYELEFFVLDKYENIVQSYTNKDTVEVDSFSETLSFTKARVSLAAFSFEPGTYKLKAVMTDIETEHSSIIEQMFNTPNYRSKKLMISDIQLSSKILPGEKGQPYVKNHRYIEPNTGRVFAHSLTEYIYVYFEAYNLSYATNGDSSTYTTRFEFYNKQGRKVGQFENKAMTTGPMTAHSIRFPLNHFQEGEYTLTVRIHDDITGQFSDTSKSFVLYESPVLLSAATREKMLY